MKSPIVVVMGSIVSLLPMFTQQSSSQKEKPQSSESCPMHDANSAMSERGEQQMGFSQTETTHHFFVKPDGGVIQVEVDDPADTSSRDNIREHLTHIAKAFSNGDFDIPMIVHDTVPPGVSEMKRLRGQIWYSFQETPLGGRVIILTTDKEALLAVHKFLGFQIEEHKTGDALEQQRLSG
jgi:hypothetical protein